MLYFLEKVNALVWGIPALILILGIGLYLSICTDFAQIRLFSTAIRSFLNKLIHKDKNGNAVSPFQALCTALAATVGTGNLAGVAGAICIGGPGAVFWMWVSAVFGMMTKFAEATLATKYCSKNKLGEKIGGPMYMITIGMGARWKWLASIYAFFGIVASLGIGNATQVNTVVNSISQALSSVGADNSFFIKPLIGILLSMLILAVLIGGAKRIGNVAQLLVPFASVVYILLGLLAIILNFRNIPTAFSSIFQGAFNPLAVTGGMVGSAFTVLRIGTSRGVFTNEAGMGTASMAHAGASVADPVEQGLMGIVEVFLDTIVICTITALAILCSGVCIPYGTDVGISLTSDAYASIFGNWTYIVIALLLCCFAFATILGWGLYGIRCSQYLFGDDAWRKFVYLQSFFVVIGAIISTDTVWVIADILNGLMAIPNLIVLGYLSPVLVNSVRNFKSPTKRSGSGLQGI